MFCSCTRWFYADGLHFAFCSVVCVRGAMLVDAPALLGATLAENGLCLVAGWMTGIRQEILRRALFRAYVPRMIHGNCMAPPGGYRRTWIRFCAVYGKYI